MKIGDSSTDRDEVAALSLLLDQALRRLGPLEEGDAACRIAAQAWAALQARRPQEARRFEITLHRLTHQRRPTPEQIRQRA